MKLVRPGPAANEDGGVLIVVAVLILALMTIIGLSSTNTSVIESKISVNDHLYKMAFYEADGATQTGIQLVEENLSCPGGFDTEPLDINDVIRVTNSDFYANPQPNTTVAIANCPDDANRDAFYPVGYTGDEARTNLRFFGRTQFIVGSAIQMAAGYEGRGKSAASGGGEINYNIHAQRVGERGGESHVMVRWRHVIGQEDTCRYTGQSIVVTPSEG